MSETKIVTFKIDEVLLDALDRYAIQAHKSRSEIIREALRQYLSKNHDLKPTWRIKKVTLK